VAFTQMYFFLTDISAVNTPDPTGIASGPYRFLEFWLERNMSSGAYVPNDQMSIRYFVSIAGLVAAAISILVALYDTKDWDYAMRMKGKVANAAEDVKNAFKTS